MAGLGGAVASGDSTGLEGSWEARLMVAQVSRQRGGLGYSMRPLQSWCSRHSYVGLKEKLFLSGYSKELEVSDNLITRRPTGPFCAHLIWGDKCVRRR